MPCGEYALMDTWRAWESPISPMSMFCTPAMSEVMAMTAAMPMTMPRMVSSERPLFADSACQVS